MLALIYKHMPTVVGLFRAAAGAWHPAGEVHVPPQKGEAGVHLAFGGEGEELIMATGSGEVLRRRLSMGRIGENVPVPAASYGSARELRAACTTHEGDLLRLALRRNDGGNAWRPELLAA